MIPLLAGCASSPSKPVVRATKIPAIQATPNYWLDQPAVTAVSSHDFYKLWDACRVELRDRFFIVDRQDYRLGVITTQPMVSKQFFEFWRSDVVTIGGIADSSLASIRRTVRFKITKDPKLGYVARPKVLVERLASVERRITAISEYNQAFGGVRSVSSSATDTAGVSSLLPSDYWYAIGRDKALEKSLASSIRDRLGD